MRTGARGGFISVRRARQGLVGCVLGCSLAVSFSLVQAAPVNSHAHPGLALLHTIRTAFDTHGHTARTAVMAAGFRTADEVVRAAAARPDVVTLQVALLRELTARGAPEGAGSDFIKDGNAGGDATTSIGAEPRYVVRGDGEGGIGSEKEEAEVEALFVRDLEEERIAVDKVPEGLAKFAVDAKRLEDLLREKIKIRME